MEGLFQRPLIKIRCYFLNRWPQIPLMGRMIMSFDEQCHVFRAHKRAQANKLTHSHIHTHTNTLIHIWNEMIVLVCICDLWQTDTQVLAQCIAKECWPRMQDLEGYQANWNISSWRWFVANWHWAVIRAEWGWLLQLSHRMLLSLSCIFQWFLDTPYFYVRCRAMGL